MGGVLALVVVSPVGDCGSRVGGLRWTKSAAKQDKEREVHPKGDPGDEDDCCFSSEPGELASAH